MPTDQLFIDPSINNPIVQVNQDTILKAAQLSNIPGISLPTISSALTQLTLPNQAIRNSYISTFTPIATTINMTTPTTTTTTSTTTQSSTIQTNASTTSKYVTISPGPQKLHVDDPYDLPDQNYGIIHKTNIWNIFIFLATRTESSVMVHLQILFS